MYLIYIKTCEKNMNYDFYLLSDDAHAKFKGSVFLRFSMNTRGKNEDKKDERERLDDFS